MIVLSSDTAIKDLLDKRSGIYSDRMDIYIGQTLASGGKRILMMVCPASQTDQKSRTMIANMLGVSDMAILGDRYTIIHTRLGLFEN